MLAFAECLRSHLLLPLGAPPPPFLPYATPQPTPMVNNGEQRTYFWRGHASGTRNFYWLRQVHLAENLLHAMHHEVP